MAKIYIGTSGFSYPHWENGLFYPETLPRSKQLEYYSDHFNTVELNSPFYRLPSTDLFANWAKRVRNNFIFSVKVSRYITHIKKLKECSEEWKTFFERASNLKDKLGPFLFQLPPSLKKDLPLLRDFVKMLSIYDDKCLFAFEFRNESWFDNEVYEFLRGYENIAICSADSPRWPLNLELTGKFVYIRMHGGKVLYGSNYSDKELNIWAKRINKWLLQGLDVYCYFNNDFEGYAVKNAKELLQKINPK
jgi:uncharacterized protein YecE (DUF72 family)